MILRLDVHGHMVSLPQAMFSRWWSFSWDLAIDEEEWVMHFA